MSLQVQEDCCSVGLPRLLSSPVRGGSDLEDRCWITNASLLLHDPPLGLSSLVQLHLPAVHA